MPRPKSEIGEVRRSQVVSVYGPGAIIDFRAGGNRGAPVSVVAAGLDEWDRASDAQGSSHYQSIREPRLQKLLHVAGFRLPPVQPDENSVTDTLVGVRFPRWLQCPTCGALEADGRNSAWAFEPGDPKRYCAGCSGPRKKTWAVPVRLVAVCERGHLEDFPWVNWAHEGPVCERPELKLVSYAGSGIGSLAVKCIRCSSAARSLAGCFGEGALRARCHGRRPWLGVDESCDRELRAVQRGASNLYFPLLESALDIPPWSDSFHKKLGVYWHTIAEQTSPEDRRSALKLLALDKQLGLPLDELCDRIEQSLVLLARQEDIRTEEYRQFVRGSLPELDSVVEFEVRSEPVPIELNPYFDHLIQVRRLREVRALRGFTRLSSPTGPDDPRLAAISVERMDWLPAIEIRGEGIFLALSEERLQKWENRSEVRQRIDLLRARRDVGSPVVVAEPTARSVMLHTLAHIVIAELSLDCGYSHASLRERIYASPEMAGVLMYTGSPDSEGTLGGLVRQGRADRFVPVLRGAFSRARWCANDPLCMDGTLTLSDALNLGACHACALAPETTCERFNRLLDRGLVVGVPGSKGVGFFEEFT